MDDQLLLGPGCDLHLFGEDWPGVAPFDVFFLFAVSVDGLVENPPDCRSIFAVLPTGKGVPLLDSLAPPLWQFNSSRHQMVFLGRNDVR